MQLTAISMGIVLMLSGASTLTLDEESVPTNEDWFKDQLGEHWDPDLETSLFTADGESEITMGEAAKQFSTRSEGVDLHRLSSADGPEDTIATAGEIYILETAVGPPEDITVRCSDGNEGHSTTSIENPAPLGLPFLRWSDYGAASSDISTQGTGSIYNAITDQTWNYTGEVHYAGNSGFWCAQSVSSFLIIVINFPIVDGTFVGPV